jgi:hypothetical protein
MTLNGAFILLGYLFITLLFILSKKIKEGSFAKDSVEKVGSFTIDLAEKVGSFIIDLVEKVLLSRFLWLFFIIEGRFLADF